MYIHIYIYIYILFPDVRWLLPSSPLLLNGLGFRGYCADPRPLALILFLSCAFGCVIVDLVQWSHIYIYIYIYIYTNIRDIYIYVYIYIYIYV